MQYRAWKAGVCRTCGTEAWEWDPAQGGHREAYIASTSRCEGDVALAQESENIAALAKDIGPSAVAGVRPVLIPRDLALTVEGEPVDE